MPDNSLDIMFDQPEYMTVKQVSRVLQVSRWTIRNWVDRGYLVKITLPSGKVRITRESVDSVLSRSGKVGASA